MITNGQEKAKNLAYLNSAEVASLLGVSLRTVANWQRRRVIPRIKIGRVVRFRRADVEFALAAFTVQAIGSLPRTSRSRSTQASPKESP